MTNITKASQDALKPCPFCGSSAAQYPDGDMEGHSIMCSGDRLEIGASCPMTAFGYATEAEAAERWNRRAALQDKAGEVQKMDTETLRSLVAGLALEIDPDADLERYPEALGFQIDMARAVMRSTKPTPVVPDGFALVPAVATFDMRAAGNIELDRLKNTPGMLIADRAFYVWSAMIAASQQKGGQ